MLAIWPICERSVQDSESLRALSLLWLSVFDSSPFANSPERFANNSAINTRGHVLVVMLAYLIRRDLSQAWISLDVTVEEGLNQLQTLCSTEIKIDGKGSCLRIPTPNPATLPLFKALNIQMPKLLPHTETRVVTRKKLPQRRQVR